MQSLDLGSVASGNELERYRQGKTNLRGFFIGQVMKLTNNRANADTVNIILDEELKLNSN